MIVATAGHVDHGKTSLVRALTGIDTDRSAEEKRRGMSIDLGFAHADFGGMAGAVGFVDVPGHERFVGNMLAGVTGVDLALLVIAADDGPMPQTREHLAILELLGVSQCVVALTKSDRVSADRVAQVELEIAALLATGPFRHAPVFPLDATRGAGVAALRQHLAAASRVLAVRSSAGHFRLVVDRSFVLAGAGRVVTGVVMAGAVQIGDPVVVSPRGLAAKVRGIHSARRSSASAGAGERCGLNLSGLELRHAPPVRGDWIVAPQAHAPSARLDVRISVLAGEARPLAHGAALRLHLGAAATNARLAIIEGRAIAPGHAGLAQLVLDAPVAALHGDRFILRDAPARRTVAGGSVIDPFGPARGRSTTARAAQLAALSLPAADAALAGLLDCQAAGVDLERFAQARNLTPLDSGQLHRTLSFKLIEHSNGPLGLSIAHWDSLRRDVCVALAEWHAEQPDSLGPTVPAVARRLRLDPATPPLRAALASLVDERAVVREGLCLRLAGHRAVLAPADAALLDRVAERLRPACARRSSANWRRCSTCRGRRCSSSCCARPVWASWSAWHRTATSCPTR